jgi:hypothetical protein
MKRAIPLFFCVFSSCAAFSAPHLFAQDNSEASPNKIKRINVAGADTYQGILDWIPVSKKSAVAFARSKTTVPALKYNLISFTLSSHGKPSIPQQASEDEGLPYCASAVWLDGGTPESAAGVGRGLVFVLFSNYATISGDAPEIAFLRCAEFNEAGDILGGWKTLTILESEAGTYIAGYSLRAVRAGDRIGIAYSVQFWHWSSPYWGPVESMLFFTETDLDGTPLGDPTRLKIYKGGIKQSAKTFDVAWNGERWLVASSVSRKAIVNSQIATLLNEVVIHSLTTGENRTAMSRQLIAVKNPNLYAYDSLSFAQPALATAPAASHDFTYLLVDSLFASGDDPDSILNLGSIYTLYRIDWRGKKIGKPLELSLPPLSLTIDSVPGQSARYHDYASYLLSPPLDTASAQAGGFSPSQFLFSRAFSIWLANYEGGQLKYQYEQIFAFYSLEPESGAVELISEGHYSWIRVICQHPLIGWMRGSPVVINDAYTDVSPYKHDSYFSRFAQ